MEVTVDFQYRLLKLYATRIKTALRCLGIKNFSIETSANSIGFKFESSKDLRKALPIVKESIKLVENALYYTVSGNTITIECKDNYAHDLGAELTNKLYSIEHGETEKQ